MQTPTKLTKIGVLQVAHVVNNVLHFVQPLRKFLRANIVNIIMHMTREREREREGCSKFHIFTYNPTNTW